MFLKLFLRALTLTHELPEENNIRFFLSTPSVFGKSCGRDVRTQGEKAVTSIWFCTL